MADQACTEAYGGRCQAQQSTAKAGADVMRSAATYICAQLEGCRGILALDADLAMLCLACGVCQIRTYGLQARRVWSIAVFVRTLCMAYAHLTDPSVKPGT